LLVGATVSGFAFSWWARIVLGRLWSSGVTRKTDHRIVTTGPYKVVRHPIYSGIIIAVLASRTNITASIYTSATPTT
jgi:protein-S-isoprenylcysteine O-methyltransferase Ste14